ncbi:MAG: glutathione peroxidase [Pseudomonadales bacterium]|nr:glutathione peroxidase [Pseudomonadales bacterium]NRA15358.1 glutathione peroxidase [Oceanospirillaceae bacterium]
MPKNIEGQKIPQISFNVIDNDQWIKINTEELFKGQSVIVFSLPGAFTPTCSSTHLPRYNELASVFAANGIDKILCVSVNDTFVMNSWAKDQQAENIEFIPDGNGDFSAAMGMLVDKSDIGFGQRSWRYSMLVRDGKIEKMFIEADLPGDPFAVSDADTMLDYLNPEAEKPKNISMLTKPGCGHCVRAKAALQQGGYPFEEIEIAANGISTSSLMAISGSGTTPQVFIDGVAIGGADELQQWLEQQ